MRNMELRQRQMQHKILEWKMRDMKMRHNYAEQGNARKQKMRHNITGVVNVGH